MSDNNKPGSQKATNSERKKPGTPATPGRVTKPAGTSTESRPIRPATPATSNAPRPNMSARALSRYEKDQQRQRWLVWGTLGVAAFIVLLIAFDIWQNTLGPNFNSVAQVGNQSISRSDYNKFRRLEIFKQAGRLQQQLAFTQGDQATQLQSQLALLQDELGNVEKRDINQETLETLVRNTVLEKAAAGLGINVSDDEVNRYLGDEFKGVVYTPTPNPTEANQNQTATAVATQGAGFATATAQNITPLPTPTPVTTTVASTVASGTLTPSPTTTISATSGISATVTATPTATTTPQPTVTNTPMAADKVQATASASQSDFLKGFRNFTRLSDDDYRRLEARPALIKKKVIENLRKDQPKIGTPYKSWKLSHILFKVEDEAKARETYEELKKASPDKLEETFVKFARERSTDTAAAAQNGDLGWVTEKTEFDKTFLEAAMKLEKGQFTEPVKTQFGWHIILATDKDPARPLDALTIKGFEKTDELGDPVFFSDWLTARVKEANVRYNTPPTPAPTPTLIPVPAFTPVIPPTNTPLPTATMPPAPTVTATTAEAGTPGATTAGATTVAATTTSAVTAVATTSAATTTSATTAVATTTVATTAATTVALTPSVPTVATTTASVTTVAPTVTR